MFEVGDNMHDICDVRDVRNVREEVRDIRICCVVGATQPCAQCGCAVRDRNGKVGDHLVQVTRNRRPHEPQRTTSGVGCREGSG